MARTKQRETYGNGSVFPVMVAKTDKDGNAVIGNSQAGALLRLPEKGIHRLAQVFERPPGTAAAHIKPVVDFSVQLKDTLPIQGAYKLFFACKATIFPLGHSSIRSGRDRMARPLVQYLDVVKALFPGRFRQDAAYTNRQSRLSHCM